MARTNSDAVKKVLAPGRDYDERRRPSLAPAIEWAGLMTDQLNEDAAAQGYTLSAARLAAIEKWLAAHAYAMSDQTYSSRSTGGGSGSFHGQTGLNLDGTKYGQMAKALDPTGLLETAGASFSVEGAWLGLPPSEQTAYENRD